MMQRIHKHHRPRADLLEARLKRTGVLSAGVRLVHLPRHGGSAAADVPLAAGAGGSRLPVRLLIVVGMPGLLSESCRVAAYVAEPYATASGSGSLQSR